MTMGYRTSQNTNMCALDVTLVATLTGARTREAVAQHVGLLRVWFSAAGLAVTTQDETPASYDDPKYFNKVRTFSFKIDEGFFWKEPSAENSIVWEFDTSNTTHGQTGIGDIFAEHNLYYTQVGENFRRDGVLFLFTGSLENKQAKEAVALLTQDDTNLENFDGTISVRIDPTWYDPNGLFYQPLEFNFPTIRTPLPGYPCNSCLTALFIRVVRFNIADPKNPVYVSDLFYDRLFKVTNDTIFSYITGDTSHGEFTAEEANTVDFFDAYYNGYSNAETILAFVASDEDKEMLYNANAAKLMELYAELPDSTNALDTRIDYNDSERTVRVRADNRFCSNDAPPPQCAFFKQRITLDIQQTTPDGPMSYNFISNPAYQC